MAYLSDVAISLRRTDYSETSQILTLLTREHGLQRLIAKGSRRSTKKRFSGGIDLLERGRLVFAQRPESGSDLCTLVEWTQQDAYAGLRTDLRRLYAAQYLAEVTPALLEIADPHPRLFDALAEALAQLSAEAEPIVRIVQYQVTLLVEVGLMPDLTQCTSCGGVVAGPTAYFSSESGGLICRDCEPAVIEKRKVSAGTIRLLRTLLADQKPHAAEPPAVSGAFDLLNYHIGYTIGHPPKLADYLLPASHRRRL